MKKVFLFLLVFIGFSAFAQKPANNVTGMYKFQPILKTLVWGTESWVLSGVPGNESIVAEGPEKGKKITDLFPGQFPLLIKFIDAKNDLSIQVHPDDKLAAERHGCKGKTEMWYIIGATQDAHLLAGLSKSITPEDYVKLVQEDKIVSVLADHKVAPGDVFYLPAGRVHAICGGCYLAEIQQTSDITYRIYDYGRLGLDGKPRQLHTQQAKDAIDYTVCDDYRTHYAAKKNADVQIVDSPFFRTTLCEAEKMVSLDITSEWLIVVCVGGNGFIESENGERVSIKEGECVLAFERTLQLVPEGGELKVLTTTCGN